MTIKYESQKIAQNFYTFAVLLFLVQVTVGIIAALQFMWPDFFILNFNIIRSLHINAMVVWLLVGMMGATYYVVPEESETEIWSLPLAKFQFWATVGTVLAVVLGESALSETDVMFVKFADAFEDKFVRQGESENRAIEESLRIGWDLLTMLPKTELKRVRDAYLEKYYPKK